MNQELLNRLRDMEDNFTERKPAGVKNREIRKTIVAFANSVPDGRTAVLYIGISDNGDIQGVSNPDSEQNKVKNICKDECYPTIAFSSEVLNVKDKSVVVVVISPSSNRPHFSGPAYIRRGAASIEASEEIFNELITGRLSKPHEILKWKAEIVTVVAKGKELGSTKHLGDSRYRASHECRVEECIAHRIRLYDITMGKYFSEPLENITISYDESKHRLMLIVQEK